MARHGTGRALPTDEGRPTLAMLLAEPTRALERALSVPAEALTDLLHEAAAHEALLSVVVKILAARVTATTERPAWDAPLSAEEGAQRLGVSLDTIRRYGAAWGIAIPLSPGVVRYSAEAIEQLKRTRRTRPLLD